MNRNTTAVRLIGTIIAILFVCSAITAFTAIGASAAPIHSPSAAGGPSGRITPGSSAVHS